MYTHEYKIRVRYADTDQMGYVYYGHYPRYFEIGRAELLRHLGYTYSELESEGIMCPVMSMQIRYLRAPQYDELITLKTTLRELPGATITFHTDVFLSNGKLAAGGFIKLAFVEAAGRKRSAAPEKLIELLKPSFER